MGKRNSARGMKHSITSQVRENALVESVDGLRLMGKLAVIMEQLKKDLDGKRSKGAIKLVLEKYADFPVAIILAAQMGYKIGNQQLQAAIRHLEYAIGKPEQQITGGLTLNLKRASDD